MALKQSICYWCFGRKVASPEELFKAAKEMGYSAIELAPEELWPKIKAAGLEVGIYGGHASLTDGLNKRENHDRIETELRANIRKAAENGIGALIVFSGNRNGLDDETGIEICAEGLRRVIKDAESYGIDLCMELLNSKVDHRDYQCDRTEWGVKMCQAVGSPRMKLLYDIYHMQIMEGDLIRTIKENVQYIGHVHTAGNPGRHDLDDQQEIYYPPVIKALVDSGYTGTIGQEFTPKGSDWKAALKQAFDACNV